MTASVTASVTCRERQVAKSHEPQVARASKDATHYLRAAASHIARTLITHVTARLCVTFFFAFFPADFWVKEIARSLREAIKYFALFSFLPDLQAQFRRNTRKPRKFRARFEETHLAGHSFILLTHLLTWPFVINSQSQPRICWLRICLTVTPEWAVHSRPRYQDSVEVNRILFAQLLCHVTWKSRFLRMVSSQFIVAIQARHCVVFLLKELGHAFRICDINICHDTNQGMLSCCISLIWTNVNRNITQSNLSTWKWIICYRSFCPNS